MQSAYSTVLADWANIYIFCVCVRLMFFFNFGLNLSIKFLSYLPNPSARAGYDTVSIFKQGLTGLNSEFSFS